MLLVATITILSEQRYWNSFRAKKTILVPDNLYAACSLEGTSFPLQCAHFRWGCSDLAIGITFSGDVGTLQLFLRCHCMGLICSRPRWTVFLWLLVDLTSQSGQYLVVSLFSAEGSATGPVWAGPDQTWGWTGNLRNQRSVLVPVLIYRSSPPNLISGRSLLDPESLEDKFGGNWLSPTSQPGIGGSLYPCVWPPVSPLLLSQWTPWVLWTIWMPGPWTGMSDPGCEISDISWLVPVLVCGSRHLWNLLR